MTVSMQQRWKRSLLLSRRRHRQAACSIVLLLTAHMVLQCAGTNELTTRAAMIAGQATDTRMYPFTHRLSFSAVVPPNAPRPPREKSGSVTDVAISVEWDAPLYVEPCRCCLCLPPAPLHPPPPAHHHHLYLTHLGQPDQAVQTLMPMN